MSSCIVISTQRKGTMIVSSSLVCPVARWSTDNRLLTSDTKFFKTADNKYFIVATQ